MTSCDFISKFWGVFIKKLARSWWEYNKNKKFRQHLRSGVDVIMYGSNNYPLFVWPHEILWQYINGKIFLKMKLEKTLQSQIVLRLSLTLFRKLKTKFNYLFNGLSLFGHSELAFKFFHLFNAKVSIHIIKAIPWSVSVWPYLLVWLFIKALSSSLPIKISSF